MIKSYERLKKLNKEKTRVPKTVQDTIPVDTIYKDGIFKSGNKYTKSYRFLDINYKIASGDDIYIIIARFKSLELPTRYFTAIRTPIIMRLRLQNTVERLEHWC